MQRPGSMFGSTGVGLAPTQSFGLDSNGPGQSLLTPEEQRQVADALADAGRQAADALRDTLDQVSPRAPPPPPPPARIFGLPPLLVLGAVVVVGFLVLRKKG